MPQYRDYQKIAIACKALGLNRKQFISDRYGHDSAKKLTLTELKDLYNHFEEEGWRATKKTGTSTNKNDDYIHIPDNIPFAKLKRKIILMHKALGYKIKGLNTRVSRQGKVDAFVWYRDGETLNTIARDYNKRLRAKGLNPDNL